MKYKAATGILVLAVLFLVVFFTFHSRQNNLTADAEEDTDDNPALMQVYTAAAASADAQPKARYQVSSSTPQFVILSFDGSKSLSMLSDTLAFEKGIRSSGTAFDFTYFINAVYFLTEDNSTFYHGPVPPVGSSRIGFSSTTADIAARVKGFNDALALGNEVGSHTVGHFDGSAWSYDEWKQEFASFNSLLSNVQINNPSVAIPTPTFLSSIHGFRAPQLGVNNDLYRLLGDEHFTYDTSGVAAADVWPVKDAYGVWHIPLGTLHVGSTRHPIVAMDYNLYVNQSGGKDNAVKGSQLWNGYLSDVENAYMDYFNTDYKGNRAPVVIAGHFSKWNDGVYWEAMKAFADNVCGQPQVRCVTFSALVDYLNKNGVPSLAN